MDDVLESSSAKSPRIVPGAESSGFVAPIIVRHDRDRHSPLTREREHGPGRDEVDERAEERLAPVLGVVLARGRASGSSARRAPRSSSPRRSKRATISPASPRRMPSGLTRTSVVSRAMRPRSLVARLGRRRPRVRASSSDGKPGGISVAQYGQTCQSDSSGWPHDGHACSSRVVQTGQTRYDGSTLARQTGQRWSSWESRSSIALISSSRSRASWMYSGGRKNM